MKIHSLFAIGVFTLAVFSGPVRGDDGAEGHACPVFQVLSCEATEGDKVVVDWTQGCTNQGITVTRAETTKAKFPGVRVARRLNQSLPHIVYGKDFLLLLSLEGHKTPAKDVKGQLETFVNEQRISRQVNCQVNGLR